MSSARRRLVILARWPAPGRCKRRLAVALGASRAAALQSRLTRHVVAAAGQACKGGIELVLAASGIGPVAAARWGADLGVQRVSGQGQGSLGLRLRRQVVRAQRDGIRQLVLIGSDLPEVAAGDLLDAFAALGAGQALVLGPAIDGGYWLLGLDLLLAGQRQAGRRRRCLPPAERLFAGACAPIDWGGPEVARQTLEAADREGLKAFLLPLRADLDRPEDLERWR